MQSGLTTTTLPDLASQLWIKISAMDASGLVRLFGSTTQLNKAIASLLRMLEEGRERRELCKPLAVAYILRGQYEQAMPFLMEAGWECPTDPELHLHQGHIYMRESNYSMAYEHFEKALLLNPKLLAAEGPRNDMFKKLTLNPNTALYWHVQGVIRFDLGMYEESVQCYARALDIDPTFQDSWYNSRVVQHILDQKQLYDEEEIDTIPARVLPIVTSYEYATLAEAAYAVSAKAVPPKEWKLWLTSGDFLDGDGSLSRDGFFGATYVNHEKKQIVLALQGSKATNDIVSCIHLVFNTVDRQWVCAKLFGEKIHKMIAADPKLRTYRVSFTGHSLGAAQAEYLSVRHDHQSSISSRICSNIISISPLTIYFDDLLPLKSGWNAYRCCLTSPPSLSNPPAFSSCLTFSRPLLLLQSTPHRIVSLLTCPDPTSSTQPSNTLES